MFSRLAFARQQPLQDMKLPKKFILKENIIENLRAEDVLDENNDFAGTPVEVGDENVVVAEDGTKYDV